MTVAGVDGIKREPLICNRLLKVGFMPSFYAFTCGQSKGSTRTGHITELDKSEALANRGSETGDKLFTAGCLAGVCQQARSPF